MTQIDVATGFPKLPEGFYWYVRRSSARDYSYITIRKDRLKWGLFTVHDEYLSMICYSNQIKTPSSLKYQVATAWSLYGSNFRERITPATDGFNPYGSYPPKNVND